MDAGQITYILSQLILGALASFLAIMLWSKTRDTAWMLIVIGVIAAYIEIIYSMLSHFGFISADFLLIGSVSLAAILLPSLRMIFFITAFFIMIFKHYRR